MPDKKTISLSLDLEDWAWDYRFKHDFPRNVAENEKALLFAVKRFAELNRDEAGNRVSSLVYVTGNVIENYPSVLKYVEKCGLRLGCHCYDHVSFRDRDIITAREDLQKFLNVAKRNCVSIEPFFRAPMFSIKASDKAHLSLIFEYFKVESGTIAHQTSVNIIHSPVTKVNILGWSLNLGGTFLSWMPVWLVRFVRSVLFFKNDLHVYLHPYELVNNPDFSIEFSELRSRFNFIKSAYYFFRQRQWNNHHGWTIEKKIQILKYGRKMTNGTNV